MLGQLARVGHDVLIVVMALFALALIVSAAL